SDVCSSDLLADLEVFVLSFHVAHLALFDSVGLCSEVRTIDERGATVLFTAEVVHETDRVVDIVHVDSRIRSGTNHGREVHKVPKHHEGIAPQRKFEYA